VAAKSKPKPKPLTDAERHARFKDMAREVGASDDPKAFDTAFGKVTRQSIFSDHKVASELGRKGGKAPRKRG